LERGAIVFAGLGPAGGLSSWHTRRKATDQTFCRIRRRMTAMISIKPNFYSKLFPQVYENKEK
jgi:capsule polysaccharide modification protein KpsS